MYKAVLRILTVASLLVYPAAYGAWSVHYPTGNVYSTGTPASGDKPLTATITYQVYQTEGSPWDVKYFGNPPGVEECGGWNVYLTWSAKSSGTQATGKATCPGESPISSGVTVY